MVYIYLGLTAKKCVNERLSGVVCLGRKGPAHLVNVSVKHELQDLVPATAGVHHIFIGLTTIVRQISLGAAVSVIH